MFTSIIGKVNTNRRNINLSIGFDKIFIYLVHFFLVFWGLTIALLALTIILHTLANKARSHLICCHYFSHVL